MNHRNKCKITAWPGAAGEGSVASFCRCQKSFPETVRATAASRSGKERAAAGKGLA